MGCVGKRIIRIKRPVTVIAAGSVVGHEEYKGPLGKCFDLHDPCDGRVTPNIGNLCFINKDGSVRPYHEIFNEF